MMSVPSSNGLMLLSDNSLICKWKQPRKFKKTNKKNPNWADLKCFYSCMFYIKPNSKFKPYWTQSCWHIQTGLRVSKTSTKSDSYSQKPWNCTGWFLHDQHVIRSREAVGQNSKKSQSNYKGKIVQVTQGVLSGSLFRVGAVMSLADVKVGCPPKFPELRSAF